MPTGHKAAKLVPSQFHLIPAVFSQGIVSRRIWTCSTDLKRWSTEHDIALLVRHVLQDAIASAGLKNELEYHTELSVFELRHDIWLVMTDLGQYMHYTHKHACRTHERTHSHVRMHARHKHARTHTCAHACTHRFFFFAVEGIPVGVVEVKRPGDDDTNE